MTATHALPISLLRPVAAPRPARLRSTSPHLLLVANGNASGLTRRPSLFADSAQQLRHFGARVETRLTTSLEELDDALATAERRVVLLGGDGSLHAAANSPHRAELALIPAGGANNVARSLGIPTDFGAAARLAVEGETRPLDAIAVSDGSTRYLAVEGVSAGFHAIARSRYSGVNSTDKRAALRAAFSAVAEFEPLTVALSLDGSCSLRRIGQVFAVNTPLYGPGLRVAPADPADGLLDVVTIEGGRGALLSMLPRLRRGSHLGRPGVTHTRARSVRIATRGRSPVIADTTTFGDTVELTVVPHALDVVAVAA